MLSNVLNARNYYVCTNFLGKCPKIDKRKNSHNAKLTGMLLEEILSLDERATVLRENTVLSFRIHYPQT